MLYISWVKGAFLVSVCGLRFENPDCILPNLKIVKSAAMPRLESRRTSYVENEPL